MKRLSPGASGWLGVAAVIVAADLLDGKTMSDAFLEASHHPVTGPVVIGCWAVLTAHLFGLLPSSVDPFHLAGKHVFLRGRY